MFRIGDFSRIARVSARLLRFYDEIGLLAPAHADPQSGYRFYTVDQLERLNRITVLKELGFSLEQIAGILQRNLAPAELRAMLELRRSDVEQTLARGAATSAPHRDAHRADRVSKARFRPTMWCCGPSPLGGCCRCAAQ